MQCFLYQTFYRRWRLQSDSLGQLLGKRCPACPQETGALVTDSVGAAHEKPVILYQYGKTRSKSNIQKFLAGFSGTLVSDAFSGYKSLDKNDENIHSAFCWAHARRDYADALKALKGDAKDLAHETVAHKALVQIAAIYKAEEALKDLTAEERHDRRQREVNLLWRLTFRGFMSRTPLPSSAIRPGMG